MDPVRKDGVGSEVKVVGIDVISLEETGTNPMIFVMKIVLFGKIAIEATGFAVVRDARPDPPLVRDARPALQNLEGQHR